MAIGLNFCELLLQDTAGLGVQAVLRLEDDVLVEVGKCHKCYFGIGAWEYEILLLYRLVLESGWS